MTFCILSFIGFWARGVRGLGFLFVEYPGDEKIASEEIDEDNASKSYSEGDVKYRMHDYRQEETIEDRFYVREYLSERPVVQVGSREIESDEYAGDDMGHEGEYGPEYPGREHS